MHCNRCEILSAENICQLCQREIESERWMTDDLDVLIGFVEQVYDPRRPVGVARAA
ncbi:MAG: hypothetical protein ACREP9_22560 [Candidatus Dormibacteraceae bacterium]